MRYLHEILASGEIVDNRQYRYQTPVLSSPAWPSPKQVKNGNSTNSVGKTFAFLRATADLTAAAAARSDNVVIIRPDGYEHNTDDALIKLTGFGQEDFTFSTGNLVGSVTRPHAPNYTLNVSSRFGDDFLKFIVADADGFAEIANVGGYSKGKLHWLLPYLWSIKMRRAWRLGLPKQYMTHVETTPQVRGRIDPLSHLTGQDRGVYRCTVREHGYDNAVTRLLARTLQVVDTHTFLPGAPLISHTLQTATHGRRHPIHELLATPPLRNPYFNAYNPLISLSKLILRQHAVGIGPQVNTNALLFDVSMLFEYFVRKLLQRAGCAIRGKTSLRLVIPRGLASGQTRGLIPDLVIDNDGVNHVFDVKYKSFDFGGGVAREDLFQLHTYVSQVAAHGPVGSCGFIYPISENRWETVAQYDGVIRDTVHCGTQRIPFYVFFLKIPDRGQVQDVYRTENFQIRFSTICQTFTTRFKQALQSSTRTEAQTCRSTHTNMA